MTPNLTLFALRRVCELADAYLQTSEQAEVTRWSDNQSLSQIEALVDVMQRRLEPAAVVDERIAKRRKLVLDSPEIVEETERLLAAGAEVDVCTQCHGTRRAHRKDRNGRWRPTSGVCQKCAPPEPIPDPPEDNYGLEDFNFGVLETPVDPDPPRARVSWRGEVLEEGDILTASSRAYLRALSMNGPDTARIYARTILDAEPTPDEVWVFGAMPDGSTVPNLALGREMTLRQYTLLRTIAANTEGLWTLDVASKATNFLNAMPDMNRTVLRTLHNQQSRNQSHRRL